MELPTVSELQVEAFVFPPTVKPPGTSKTLFLGGAGRASSPIPSSAMRMHKSKFFSFLSLSLFSSCWS